MSGKSDKCVKGINVEMLAIRVSNEEIKDGYREERKIGVSFHPVVYL